MGTPETVVNDTPETQNVDFEKRFKDTQAYATKLAQEKAEIKKHKDELEAELSVLRQAAKPSVKIDEQLQSELENLKYSDPEAWRNRLNQLEAEANNEFNTKISEAKQSMTMQQELNRRTSILGQFQQEHPDVAFTDELLQFDIPLRITKKLEDGKVSYEEFLNEVYSYVKTPKVIGSTNSTLDQPNLNKLAGDDTPTKTSTDSRTITQSYANMEF